jgi:vacuolar-type H+-ATPase subunit H
MAFTNYYPGGEGGKGNWSIFGITLPELGITEALGGNPQSTYTTAPYNVTTESPSSTTPAPYVPSGTERASAIPSTEPTPAGTYTFGGQSGLTEEEYQQAYNDAVNKSYSSTMSVLNSQESALKGNEQNYYDIATTPYTSQVPLINQAAQQGQNAITGQQNTAGIQSQNALAAARQLYNELMSRNTQAFGSGALGSVGQAAGEILGRTAQQQFGNIRTNTDTTLQGLYTAARDLTDKTNVQLNSLDQQKQYALAQAKLAFQDKLDYISQKKDEAAQVKAQNKLDAMKEYRDYVRQLANQADQLRASIISTAQANGQDITTALNNFYGAMNTQVGQGATNVYNQGRQANAAVSNLKSKNQLSGSGDQASILAQQGITAGGYNPTATATTANGRMIIGYDASGQPIYANSLGL